MSKIRNKLIATLTVFALLFTSLSAVMFAGSNFAKAEGEEPAQVEALFQLQDGASAGYLGEAEDGKDYAGLRWKTIINKAYYTSLSGDLEFGTIIAPKSYGDLDFSKISQDALGDWYVNGTDDYVSVIPSDKIATQMESYGDNLSGEYVMYSAIRYDELDTNIIKQASTELVAKAYVKITNGDDVTYNYSTADTVRSLRNSIAYNSIVGGLGSTDIEALLDMIDVSAPVKSTSAISAYALYNKGGNVEVFQELIGKSIVGASVNAVEVEATLDSATGAVTFGAVNSFPGKTAYLSVYTSNGDVYYKQINIATGISTVKEFNDVFGYTADVTTATIPTRDGHYVLTNNIDFAGVEYEYGFINTSFVGNTSTKGLTGTFDGNGYTIYNLTAQKGGVFGIVNGTVKNVAFINVDVDNTNATGILATYTGNKASFENVYLNYNGNYSGKKSLLTYYVQYSGLNIENCYFQGNGYLTNSTATATALNHNHISFTADTSAIVISQYAISRRGTNGNAQKDANKSGSTSVAPVGRTTNDGNYSVKIYRYVSVDEMLTIYTDTTGTYTQKDPLHDLMASYANNPYFSVNEQTGKIGWVKDTVSYTLYQDSTLVLEDTIRLTSSGEGTEAIISVKDAVGLDVDGFTYVLSENNDGVVDLDGAKLTAKKVGTATLLVKKDNVVWFTLTVEVTVPVYQKDLIIEVEQDSAEGSEDGVLTAEELASIFGEDSNDIVKVVSLDADLVVALDGDNRIIFKDNAGNPFVATGKSYKVVLYNDTYGVELSVMPITKIIRQASDLAVFTTIAKEIQAPGKDTTASDLSKMNTFNGYYILGGDINASGINAAASGDVGVGVSNGSLHSRLMYGNGSTLVEDGEKGQIAMSKGLTGVFDGRGYTISNLVAVRGGLFGMISGTVKNVAFTNLKQQYRYGTVTGGYSYLMAIRVFSTAQIQNVYVEHTGANDTALFGSLSRTATITNLYYKTGAATFATAVRNLSTETQYGSSGIYNSGAAYNNFSNVVIVSKGYLGGNSLTTGGHVVKDANSKFSFTGNPWLLTNQTIKHYIDASDMTTMYNTAYPYKNESVWNSQVTTSAKEVIDTFENDYFNVVITKADVEGVETITNVAIQWANKNAQ